MVDPWFRPVRWTRPTRRHMASYPQGRPPFDPFPEATQMCQSDCPIKIFNILIRGGRPRTREYGPPWIGQSYHEAIVELKSHIISEPSLVSGGVVNVIDRLESLSQGIVRRVTESRRGTPEYERTYSKVRQYIKRKARTEELQSVPDEEHRFELSVTNPYTHFESDGFSYTYPLRCRIDELNLSTGQLIERFSGDSIPTWKPVQAWLNLRALSSLKPSEVSKEMRDFLRSGPQIVVETPAEDVIVEDDFTDRVLQAYAWYKEIFRPSGSLLHLFEISKCQPPEFDDECPFLGTHCFTARRDFPSPEVKRNLRPYGRRVLYDLVWDQDLYVYQASMLTPKEQLESEISWNVSIAHSTDNIVEAELSQSPSKLREEDEITITLESYLCGERVNGKVLSIDGTSVIFRINPTPRTPVSLAERTATIYRRERRSVSIFKVPKLERIARNLQHTLHRATLLGATTEQRFRESGALMTLDAVFAGTPIMELDEDQRDARMRMFLEHFVRMEDSGVVLPAEIENILRRSTR